MIAVKSNRSKNKFIVKEILQLIINIKSKNPKNKSKLIHNNNIRLNHRNLLNTINSKNFNIKKIVVIAILVIVSMQGL